MIEKLYVLIICLFATIGTALCVNDVNVNTVSSPPPITQSFIDIYKADNYTQEFTHGVVMDLPPSLRQSNWGGGSCVHASTVSLLRWQGQYEMADWWRQNYSGGEGISRLVKRMDAAGLRFAYTDNGDWSFLQWCMRTGRGAGIFYKTNHAINCVGMDASYVYLLDNNNTSYPEKNGYWERVSKEEFKRRWLSYGGVAWTLVYYPPAPLPLSN
jgi:hypothetical protein